MPRLSAGLYSSTVRSLIERSAQTHAVGDLDIRHLNCLARLSDRFQRVGSVTVARVSRNSVEHDPSLKFGTVFHCLGHTYIKQAKRPDVRSSGLNRNYETVSRVERRALLFTVARWYVSYAVSKARLPVAHHSFVALTVRAQHFNL